MVVAVDFFTKWVEVEALASITTGNIRNFLWKSIVCRYDIPHIFVTDNGKQFDRKPFWKWCVELHIRNYFSSLGHPQANGQVEAMNKTLMKGAWVDYLLEVLWSYRTTVQTPTGETPFSLAFRSEAVIPLEVGSISFRVKHYNLDMNHEGIRLSLGLLSERREDAQTTMAAFQQRTTRYFNKKVKPRQLKVGDWVLRKVSIAT